MPIIQGPNTDRETEEFPEWGLAHFRAGQRNVTEAHYHDCDEFVFVIEGKSLMRAEGVTYTLGKGDVLVTRMGDEHELLEIIEDTTHFWACTELRGQKRRGHLHRPQSGRG
jgi:mannose-6-phosphate isomerase-like protein (cupin superfamily)